MILKFQIEQHITTLYTWYNFKFNKCDVKHAKNNHFLYVWDVLDTRLRRRWNKHDS